MSLDPEELDEEEISPGLPKPPPAPPLTADRTRLAERMRAIRYTDCFRFI